MGRRISLAISKIDIIVPFLVLLFLLPYTYAHFQVRPFLGLDIHAVSGVIISLINQDSSEMTLNIGDKVLQVDTLEWEEFRQNVFDPDLSVEAGRRLQLTIQRGDEIFKTMWTVPFDTRQELHTRLWEGWWYGYVFWIAGTLVILFIRPKHSRRLLLAIFLYLSAIWLTAGLVSAWGDRGIWNSSLILHSAFWILVPVSLHFHWNFPSPLTKTPKGWWLIYVAGISLAFAEWFNLLPQTSYLIGGLIAAIGSIVLLLLHAILQPEHREDVIPLVILLGLALLPVIVMGISTLINPFTTTNPLVLITLIAYPGAYLFTVYRHQIGDMELRHNRLVAVFIFLGLLSIIFVTIGLFLESQFHHASSAYVVAIILIVAVLSSILTILFYSPIQRAIDQYIIGIPHDTSHLIETYSARITTSLDMDSLVQILTVEILPSLMIRQSSMYRLRGTDHIQKLFSIGVNEVEIHGQQEISKILHDLHDNQKRTPQKISNQQKKWVRQVIPLNLNRRIYGVWLLGRRDPDDHYSKADIKSIRSIADQTAIALTNIDQADYLHTLYQSNIDRHEAERQKLALELHDQVLGQLAIMITNPKAEPQAEIDDICLDIAATIRKMVDGLRPAMLNFGLCHAIEELCDNIYDLSDNGLAIKLELPFTGIRHQPQAELHLYRIIQQACFNILHHAHARQIFISGSINEDNIDISIKDDGVGFQIDDELDLPDLLYKKHYGIVGMYERASLIGAHLFITSSPGTGTTVHIQWKPEAAQDLYGEADSIATIDAI